MIAANILVLVCADISFVDSGERKIGGPEEVGRHGLVVSGIPESIVSVVRCVSYVGLLATICPALIA